MLDKALDPCVQDIWGTGVKLGKGQMGLEDIFWPMVKVLTSKVMKFLKKK